ncbi:MAG: DUF4286 family protein [Candidatus Azobacteroides sp.]|nr:DUF4286 family protein [Candidatus Azobacteroides sp.]
MLIYNTTFHVEKGISADFLRYIKGTYLPAVSRSGQLSLPRLAKVLTMQDEQEGDCFSLQFSVESSAIFDSWYALEGEELLGKLYNHFQNRVLYFSTFLEEIPFTA